jgi:hypothetical protein
MELVPATGDAHERYEPAGIISIRHHITILKLMRLVATCNRQS